MAWVRARTKAQKEQRISKIIDATSRLYDAMGFEAITFVSIAKEARFTRSNLYKYFNSKEEIFFEFLKHDMVLWRRDLEDMFEPDGRYSVGQFALMWQTAQGRHERMLDLVRLLHPVLEKNASEECLIGFKRAAKSEFQSLSRLLCRIFPKLGPDNAFKFLNMQLAISIGFYEMTTLSENQRTVLAMPEFGPFHIDYDTYFRQSVEYMIRGLLTEGTAGSP